MCVKLLLNKNPSLCKATELVKDFQNQIQGVKPTGPFHLFFEREQKENGQNFSFKKFTQ